MGIQDRDYYREHWRKRQQAEAAEQAKTSEADSGSHPLRRTGPPELLGANWHWSLKLLVWLAIAVLLLAGRRLLPG